MICKCNKCENYFEAKGFNAIEVLIGGKECPICKGNIDKITIIKKGGRK